ncbi:MAG TPA: GNAT family N-acetyltransferase, partial [Phaeodactylibacter sp.]|nr:GNAT family N-acetyltransferase [Phaeodactylibacter sp.]
LARWLDWLPTTTTLEDTRRFLFDAMRFNEGGQRCTYMIMHRSEIAGVAGLVRVDYRHHEAELGYWLAEPLQGRGIVSKSCAALLRYAFADLCLNRVVLKTMRDNQASRAVAQRLGFVHEGRLREAFFYQDSYHDLELYSILRKDWKKL